MLLAKVTRKILIEHANIFNDLYMLLRTSVTIIGHHIDHSMCDHIISSSLISLLTTRDKPFAIGRHLRSQPFCALRNKHIIQRERSSRLTVTGLQLRPADRH